ncbi:DUF7696 family protein [Bosea thiooxidans]
MTTRPVSMKFSVLAGREVDTNSEEWKHECEVRFLAGLSLTERNRVFDGEKDGLRGMKSIRGEGAVARLRAEVDRDADLTKA